MPHTIISDKCQGVAQCANACPVGCIKKSSGKNQMGTDYFFVDFQTCIDCGICLQVCPVEGAVIPEERKELQKQN